MRKLLLATAAIALVGVSSASAAPGDVIINSFLAPDCSLISSDPSVSLGPTTAPQSVAFTTNCNFSAANLTVNFSSLNGGVKNAVENVTKTYTVTFNGETETSAAGLFHDVTLASGGTAGNDIARSASLALTSALTVGGTYQDTLTISVSP